MCFLEETLTSLICKSEGIILEFNIHIDTKTHLLFGEVYNKENSIYICATQAETDGLGIESSISKQHRELPIITNFPAHILGITHINIFDINYTQYTTL